MKTIHTTLCVLALALGFSLLAPFVSASDKTAKKPNAPTPAHVAPNAPHKATPNVKSPRDVATGQIKPPTQGPTAQKLDINDVKGVGNIASGAIKILKGRVDEGVDQIKHGAEQIKGKDDADGGGKTDNKDSGNDGGGSDGGGEDTNGDKDGGTESGSGGGSSGSSASVGRRPTTPVVVAPPVRGNMPATPAKTTPVQKR